jgi:hypothetical protein
MKRMMLIEAIAAVLFAAFAIPAAAQGPSAFPYRIRPGDRLTVIAVTYCTTWQEVYALNRAVIGSNPNALVPGTVIFVVNRCPYPVVYDRGPRPHAMGTVWGNLYYVVRGDTLYSIGARFGLPWQQIAQANGIAYPPSTQAGQRLVIPGLGWTPIPWPTPPTPTTSAIRIDSPLPGAVLPATFVVSGWGRSLFEGNVVVRAYNAQRILLAEKATVLQGPNVGTGGEGTWSVQLTVNTPPGTQGVIEASSPQPTPAMAAVTVVYGSGSSGSVIYPPGQCQIQAAVGKPIYNTPNGQVMGNFASNGWFNALERQTISGMNWYKIQPGGSGGGPPAWAPTTSLTAIGTGCR